jgi:hypothetical protein
MVYKPLNLSGKLKSLTHHLVSRRSLLTTEYPAIQTSEMRFSILFPVVALAVLVSGMCTLLVASFLIGTHSPFLYTGHAADEDLSHLSARQLAERQVCLSPSPTHYPAHALPF